jgi:hypothetical protein
MTAADRPQGPSTSRFVALLTQIFRRSPRPRGGDSGNGPDVRARPSPKIDLGDLAVAQFVHDLRNQLMVMITCTDRIFELVERGQADQEIAELRQCADRASLLTRDLLMAARPRYATRGLVELNETVNAALGKLSRVMGDGIHLRIRLSAEPVTVMAEALEVERILLNLALNARDAMVDGGDLTIETDVIADLPPGQVAGAPPVRYARLSVGDTGCGMAPDVEARAFEPFYTTKQTGTGLGLSSVAFTVRQLQGMVSLQSEPGVGTRVTCNFPVSGDRCRGSGPADRDGQYPSSRFEMSSARWLARNSMMRKSARPCVLNGSSAMMASMSCRLLPTARMIPPSRGIFRPEIRKFPDA